VLGQFAALWMAITECAFLALAGGGSRLAGASGPRLLFYDALVVLLAGPVVGLFAGAVAAGVHLLATVLAPQRWQEPVWKARAYVALSIPWAAWVAQQAFSGPRARALPYRSVLAVGTGIALLGAIWLLGRVGASVAGRLAAGHASSAVRIALVPVLLAGSVLLYAVDLLVLPRLYPFFHWSLGAAALLLAWLGMGAAHLAFGRDLRRRFGRLARPGWAAGGALAVLAIGLVGQRQVGRSHRLRGLLFERTSAAAKVLSLSSRLGVVPKPEPLRAAFPSAGSPHAHHTSAVALRAHPAELRGSDVVLLTVDALRADRIGLLGFRRRVGGSRPVSITPNIDRVFRSGVIFHRAYTSTPRTSYALVSLLTGLPMHALLERGVHRRWPTLPEVLAERGHYRTACFYPKAIFTIDQALFRRYELEHLGFQSFHFEGHDMPAAARTDQVLGYLDGPGRAAKPLLLWVHYFDPHEPYVVRPGYEAFGRSARDRYDAEVAYVDAQIGRLIDGVRRRRPGKVIWVLAADHGEEFGEHGGTNHGTTLFEEQVRVPLLVTGPGIPSRVVKAPVSLLWVPGSLTRLVGVTPPPPMGDVPLLDIEPGSERETQSAVIADLDDKRMVAEGRYRLLQDRSRSYLALYNLRADPGEMHPLDIDRKGPTRRIAARLLGRLEQWLRRLERLRRSSERVGSGAIRLALVSADLARRRRAAQLLLRQALIHRLSLQPAPASEGRSTVSTARHLSGAGPLSSAPLLLALKKRLGDSDPEVRHYALLTLALEGRAPAERDGDLLALAQRWDLPVELALGVGVVLARRGLPAASRLLARLLGRLHSVDQRVAVVRLLGDPRIATDEALATLVSALGDWELSLASLRAIAALARSPATRSLACFPEVFGVLRSSSEHLGHRAEAMRTLAALGSGAAENLLARWLRHEPDRGLLALGLSLLAKWPAGRPRAPSARTPPGLRWFLVLPSALVDAPAGACLPGGGCRLEPSPTVVTWPVALPNAWSAADLFLVTDASPSWPPEVTLEGERLPVEPQPVFGSEASSRLRRVWRVIVPAEIMARLRASHLARVSLRDGSGRGVVVRVIAWRGSTAVPRLPPVASEHGGQTPAHPMAAPAPTSPGP